MSNTEQAVELYELKVDSPKEGEASLHRWARGPQGEWYYSQIADKADSGWYLAAGGPPDKAAQVELPAGKLVHDERVPVAEEVAAVARTPGDPPEIEERVLKDPREREFLDAQEERRQNSFDSEQARAAEFAKLSDEKVDALEVPAEPDRVSTAELAREVKDADVPTTAVSEPTAETEATPATDKPKK